MSHHWAISSRAQFRRARVSLALIGAAMLTGCAWFSPDAGMGVVADVAQRELNKDVAGIRTPDEAETVRLAVHRLLAHPLTADAAVQVALLNNRGLQAAYNDLMLAEAAMVEASLPPNPRFSYLRIAGSSELEIERTVVADILARHIAGRLRHRARAFPPGAAARRARDLAARVRHPAHLLPRGRRAGAGGVPRPGAVRRRDRGAARGAAGRDRRDEQARPGARAGVLRRHYRAARHHAASGRERARGLDSPARPVGRRAQVQAAGRAAGAAAARADAGRDRRRGGAPPRRPADRPHGARRPGARLWPHS